MQEFDPNENPGVARSVGEIVDRVTLLVHDEIDLAKAELMSAVQNLVRGTVAGVLGGIFAVFGLVIFLQAVALFLNDLFDWDNYPWLGYLVVAMLLFIFGALAALFAAKKIKKGSQLTPEMAIEEARKTQEALRPPEPVEAQVVPATTQQTTTQPTTQPATKPATQQSKPAAPPAAPAKPAAPAPAKPAAPAPAGDDKSAKRAAKEAAKAKAKAEKQRAKEEQAAAKAKAKADKEAAKARAEAEQQAEKARKQAEKQAEKDRKQAEKAAKKAGNKISDDKQRSKGNDQPPKAGPPAAGGN